MSNDEALTVGSGNVFADLGFDNPTEELMKAKLAREIRAIITRRKLNQTDTAKLMGVRQPDVSMIVTGRTGRYSIDRLVSCLDRLGYRAEVVVRQKTGRDAARVVVA